MASPKPGTKKDGTSMSKNTPPSAQVEPHGASLKVAAPRTGNGRKSLR